MATTDVERSPLVGIDADEMKPTAQSARGEASNHACGYKIPAEKQEIARPPTAHSLNVEPVLHRTPPAKDSNRRCLISAKTRC